MKVRADISAHQIMGGYKIDDAAELAERQAIEAAHGDEDGVPVFVGPDDRRAKQLAQVQADIGEVVPHMNSRAGRPNFNLGKRRVKPRTKAEGAR